MATQALEIQLFVTLILLVILILAAAFWPPHRHKFDKLVAEQWDHEGHHWQCWQCRCGEQKPQYFPLPSEDD